ncbi:MAG: Gfo/Idh/MocA family protein [Pseudorhodoplanes sp.]
MCVGDKSNGFLRFGIVGLGVGATAVFSALSRSRYSTLVAGADTDGHVRRRFSERFPDSRAYESIEDLCADDSIDAIWISTPNRLHADHAVTAANAKKHVIISKPMTTTLGDAERIIEACERNQVKLIAGHSLGFSPAITEMARLTQPGQALGQVRAVQLVAFTDWMLLPRTAEEVDEKLGGGIIHRQSPHQIDAIRLLCGGKVDSVRAHVGSWMPERQAPGFFTAFLQFENGAVGTASHNAYGHLVTSEIVDWGKDVGISGCDVKQRAAARTALRNRSLDEDALKDSMRVGGAAPLFDTLKKRRAWLPLHLGLTFVSCDHGDLRHSPHGVYMYWDEGRTEVPVGDDASWFGFSEIEELYRAVAMGEEVYRDGYWGMATLEVALAIQQSSESRKEIKLRYQTGIRPNALKAASRNTPHNSNCVGCLKRKTQ